MSISFKEETVNSEKLCDFCSNICTNRTVALCHEYYYVESYQCETHKTNGMDKVIYDITKFAPYYCIGNAHRKK